MNTLKRAIISSAIDAMHIPETGVAIKHYCFSPDFIGFSGHFPGFPVLPAIVQVLTVLTLAEEMKGCPLELVTVERAKFLLRLGPSQEIEVQCRECKVGKKPGFEGRLRVTEGLAATFFVTYVLREKGS
jgi:3-hydroxyacyl-[acyl-carrier-protein] dehydratase